MNSKQPNTESDEQLFDTAMALIDKLQKGKASKKTAALLAVSIFLDVALSAVTIFLVISLNSTQQAISLTGLQQCQSMNRSRMDDLLLWNTFFNDALPPGTKRNKKNEVAFRDIAGLRKVAEAKDAPRDCVRIYGAH